MRQCANGGQRFGVRLEEGSDLASELEQEMDAHLQFLIDENLERGMAPDEARFCGVTRVWQYGRRAGAKLSILAIPQIRITASGHSLCIARDRESASLFRSL